MARRSGGCRAASATRSQTSIDSRPVAGGSNGRLTRQAIGPSLEIRADWLPPWACDLSVWMVTPRRRETAQPGTGSAGRGGPLEARVLQHAATSGGLRKRGGPGAQLPDPLPQRRFHRRRQRDLRRHELSRPAPRARSATRS